MKFFRMIVFPTERVEVISETRRFSLRPVIELKKKSSRTVLRSTRRPAFHLICASESEMKYARLNPQRDAFSQNKARF